MIITKTQKNIDGLAKKGEIIGIEVQVGSKQKNEKAPTIFSEKYRRKAFGYFLVKEVNKEDETYTIMNLDTKETHIIPLYSARSSYAVYRLFHEKLIELAKRFNFANWSAMKSEKGDEKTFSAIINIYPSFVVTSLSKSVMNDDGTFTFSLDDVDGISLDKVSRYKEKIMLMDY